MLANRKLWAMALSLAMLVAFAAPAAAADYNMTEANEPDTDGTTTYPLLSNVSGQINAISALRISDDPAFGNDWVTINAQFNEPRSSTNHHKGVDLQTSINSTLDYGRPVFVIFNNGTVTDMNTYTGYGNTATVKHNATIGGVTYWFSSFYAHLYDYDSTMYVGKPVSTSQKVGRSGWTGLTSKAVHLHLETKMTLNPSAAGDGLYRKYSPTFFYFNQTAAPTNYGLDMSYLTRLSGTFPNEVRFRTTGVDLGSYRTSRNVTLNYSLDGGATWNSVAMNYVGDGTAANDIYAYNLGNLAPPGSQVLFLVRAENDTWINGTYVGALRPWRHQDGTWPTDRPFSQVVQ